MKNKKVRERNSKDSSSINKKSSESKSKTKDQEVDDEIVNPSPVSTNADQELVDETTMFEDVVDVERESSKQPKSKRLSKQLYSCLKCSKKFSKKPYALLHCKTKTYWKCEKCGMDIK